MNSASRSIDRRPTLTATAVLALLTAGSVLAQTPATLGDGSAAAEPPRTSAELDTLVGPIALYPDDLVAIVLPAATFPLQIVQAARYLDALEDNPQLEPNPDWDDSVVALLNYPEVLALLNDDLDWTWELGEAVISQQSAVLDSIQSFRDRAYAAGNLATDERQLVAEDDQGTITIAPADPEVIYVPYYDPARVVVNRYVPAYHYYPHAYPAYYYPYPAGYSFRTGFFWGVTSAFLVSWHDPYLHVRHHSHFGHPYYGHRYYTPWYARTNVYVNVYDAGNHHRWWPGHHHGGRPQRHAGYSRERDHADGSRDARRRPGGLPPRMRGQREPGYTQPRTAPLPEPRVDERRQRRLRTGEPQRDAAIIARRNAAGSREITERYRRPRGTDGQTSSRAAANDTPRLRPGRVAARPDAHALPPRAERRLRIEDRGRGIAGGGRDLTGSRTAPPRGASPAARGMRSDGSLQGRRTRIESNGVPGTARGRLAPAPRAPARGNVNPRPGRAYTRPSSAQRAPAGIRQQAGRMPRASAPPAPRQAQQARMSAPARANPAPNQARARVQGPSAQARQPAQRGRFVRK